MASPTRRVMLDPSVFLDPDVRTVGATPTDGLDLTDPAIRELIIVPQTFASFVEGTLGDVSDAFAQQLQEFGSVHPATDRALLTDVSRFSHREATFDIPSHEEVRVALLLEHGPIGAMYADEWAFLQSQSTLLSKLRRPLEAFRDAGSAIVEFGRKTGRNLIEQVIPKDHLPDVLTARIFATAAAKWIVVGGASVGGGTLGAVAGMAIGGPPGALAGKGAAGWAVGKAATAAVLAIDPDTAVDPTGRV